MEETNPDNGVKEQVLTGGFSTGSALCLDIPAVVTSQHTQYYFFKDWITLTMRN